MIDSLGKKTAYPELTPRAMSVSSEYINRYIGVSLEARHMAELLTKMQLASSVASDGALPCLSAMTAWCAVRRWCLPAHNVSQPLCACSPA